MYWELSLPLLFFFREFKLVLINPLIEGHDPSKAAKEKVAYLRRSLSSLSREYRRVAYDILNEDEQVLTAYTP